MTDHPAWMDGLIALIDPELPDYFAEFRPPANPLHTSAVLMLFGATDDHGEDVVLTQRSLELRAHAGQVSFPGGSLDPEDRGPIDAALREAEEEVGVDPASVDVVGHFPSLYLSPSGHAVTPVLGWWREPGPIGVVDTREVARVARVPLTELTDPVNRFTVAHPSGYRSPGFDVAGLFVWGFTAKLLATVIDLAGLERPWDPTVTRPLPSWVLAAWRRNQS